MAASPALVVFATALATALATGAGALPFAFGRAGMQRWLGAGNAVASGVMLGASAGLVIEGAHRDTMRTVIGALAGGHGSYCQRRSRKHHAWLSSLDNTLEPQQLARSPEERDVGFRRRAPPFASGSGVRSVLPSLPATRVHPGDDDHSVRLVAATPASGSGLDGLGGALLVGKHRTGDSLAGVCW